MKEYKVIKSEKGVDLVLTEKGYRIHSGNKWSGCIRSEAIALKWWAQAVSLI